MSETTPLNTGVIGVTEDNKFKLRRGALIVSAAFLFIFSSICDTPAVRWWANFYYPGIDIDVNGFHLCGINLLFLAGVMAWASQARHDPSLMSAACASSSLAWGCALVLLITQIVRGEASPLFASMDSVCLAALMLVLLWASFRGGAPGGADKPSGADPMAKTRRIVLGITGAFYIPYVVGCLPFGIETNYISWAWFVCFSFNVVVMLLYAAVHF